MVEGSVPQWILTHPMVRIREGSGKKDRVGETDIGRGRHEKTRLRQTGMRTERQENSTHDRSVKRRVFTLTCSVDTVQDVVELARASCFFLSTTVCLTR